MGKKNQQKCGLKNICFFDFPFKEIKRDDINFSVTIGDILYLHEFI